MSLLWLDSFDHYATGDLSEKYTAGGGTLVPSVHGNGVSLPGCRIGLPVASPTMIAGASVTIHILSATFHVLFDQPLALFPFQIIANGDGSISLSTSAFVQGTSVPNVVQEGQTYYIWVKATNLNSSSAGTCQIYVNGVLRLNLTGVNYTAGFPVSPFGWTAYQIGRSSPGIVVDDLIVMDGVDAGDGFNDILVDGNGVPRVLELVVKRMNAPGDLTEWNPSPAVPNWQNVDDQTPDGDATYNYALSTQNGARDLYGIEDLAPDETLLGAQLLISARRNGTGSALIAPLTKQAGTVRQGATVGLGVDYAYTVIVPYGTAPDGSTWTREIFNAIQAGQTRVS